MVRGKIVRGKMVRGKMVREVRKKRGKQGL
jgi:hypothetical protein